MEIRSGEGTWDDRISFTHEVGDFLGSGEGGAKVFGVENDIVTGAWGADGTGAS
jgi:hypothetical protein